MAISEDLRVGSLFPGSPTKGRGTSFANGMSTRNVNPAPFTTNVVHTLHLPAVLNSDDERLTLVTCYPFRAINPRGPLRYVVTAVRI
jgi:hypothetical protein